MNKAQCPFKLSKDNNILVICEPLGNIYSYYNKIDNQKFIHVNSDMPFWIQNFSVAYCLYFALHDIEYDFLTNKKNYKIDPLRFAIKVLCYNMEFSEFKKLAHKDGLFNNLNNYYQNMLELYHA